MTRRGTRLWFWLWLALAGISGAVIGGACEALLPAGVTEFSRQQYFRYQLYATGFRELASFVNRWLPYAVASVLLLAAAYRLGRSGHGRRWGLARAGLLLLAAACIAVYYPYHTGRWHDFMLALPGVTARLRPLVFGPIGLLVPLAILVWVLGRLRARRTSSPPAEMAQSEMPPGPLYPLWSKLGMAASRAAKIFVALLAAVFFALNCASWLLTGYARYTARTQPNIIFIMVDTLRADHVGCYGYDLPTTPNIDQFASEATRFEHAVSQAPYTLWSVTSMMSSRYPESLFPMDIEDDACFANVAPPMLAEFLRDKEYATAAIISNTLLSAAPLTAQGYDSYDDSMANSDVTSPATTRAAIKRVSALKGGKFFLSLVYMDPHQPYVHHPQFNFGDSALDEQRRKLISAAYPREFPQRRKELQGYDSDIAFTDHHIGLFLDELKRLDLYDDACIVFFSDHGEEFLEHGSWGHRWTLYEEALQVPLIIKFPGQRQGRVIGGNFPLIDLVPSLLANQGYDPSPLEMHGDSNNLAKLLHCADKPIFSATLEGMQSVKHRAHKYIRNLDTADIESQRMGLSAMVRVTRNQFYDLSADPLEQRDLMTIKPANAKLLTDLLQAHDLTPRAMEMKGATVKDNTLHDRLDSLGYLNPGAPIDPDER